MKCSCVKVGLTLDDKNGCRESHLCKAWPHCAAWILCRVLFELMRPCATTKLANGTNLCAGAFAYSNCYHSTIQAIRNFASVVLLDKLKRNIVVPAYAPYTM